MKKTAFILMTLFLGTGIIFHSCDKKQSTISNTEDNIHLKRDVYLGQVYPDGYSIEKNKSFMADGIPMIIYEIKPSGKHKTAYIIEHEKSHDLLYFVEFNPSTKELKTFDFFNNENATFMFNARSKNHVGSSDSFDLFSIIDININTSAKVPFWGYYCYEYYNEDDGRMWERCCYYRVWIAFNCENYIVY